MAQAGYEFITKKQLIASLSNENILVAGGIQEKLDTFQDNDMLAIELTINSPAKVVGITLLDMNIVDFMISKLINNGTSRDEINEAFKPLGR